MVIVDQGNDPLPPGWIVVGLAAAVAQGVAMRWRRTQPERVMAVAIVGGLATLLLAPQTVLPVAGMVAIFSLAANRPPRVSLVGLAGLLALSATNFFQATSEDTVFTMTLVVGLWALGEAARNRRVAIHEEARRAVSEEQARIARELHDVIAHSVSVIVVQAGAAEDVFDERPDQARAALRSIEQAGRDALGELRRLLGAVRLEASSGGDAPQPGLDRLEELAEPLRASGLEVVVRREGATAPVPAGVELSAYRIVQEALTNTLRHARATRAEVTVRYGPDALEVEVGDEGRGPAAGDADGGGLGLIGMRERASLVGGTLEAGPLERGGYRVHARLPLEAAQ
jgi:signal transduction histidine kinase